MGEVRGNYWVALPGAVVKAAPEQMRPAVREERHAWRMVQAELRTKMVDLEHYSGQRFEDITGGERPSDEVGEDAPPEPEDQAPPAEAPDAGGQAEHYDLATDSGDEQEEHPTGRRRLRGKQTVHRDQRALGDAVDRRSLGEAHQPTEGNLEPVAGPVAKYQRNRRRPVH